jgi:hypothetical protein
MRISNRWNNNRSSRRWSASNLPPKQQMQQVQQPLQ